ncbi:hypothetical protein EDC56_3402 [Sinobacterium caligoides]|uniref:Transposase IS200-like domain-containing protein n=2 Tax=Sinobacterium caligoides TaxID=933926 RepID=A0A3N2DG06_9GAMM|nr:transposase [Sinobacterium caligoides]ROR98669.1 hypothetical protein EDC56_3402 [Sinobacterium caligoides]
MPTARKNLVSISDTPYYHCVSRCVRRAFLCGVDPYDGKDYEHRREWVESRLLLMAEVYAIDLCAYAVMSNHLHVVLRVDEALAESWTSLEVVERWHRIFNGTLLTQRFAKGLLIPSYELDTLNETIAEYRSRLSDISWFMRSLSEPIARMANKEDRCSGRFWEGRFKSQALLDEAALLTCMAYVDLNPVRAKMAATPEESSYTSIQRRIAAVHDQRQPAELLAFVGDEHEHQPDGLHFHLRDYLLLIDQSGRVLREDKRGAIDGRAADILSRLNIPHDHWITMTRDFGKLFTGPVGTVQELDSYCGHLARKRRHSASLCQQLFG